MKHVLSVSQLEQMYNLLHDSLSELSMLSVICSSIEVYETPSLKLLCTVQQHHKIINTLRWHHQHSDHPELHCLLASGSSNALVYIHDLRSAIGE